MTGPQDRPIWCDMTDFLFFWHGWEKQYRRAMQKFRTTASGSGFRRCVPCLCPQPFLAPCSSQRVLLCPLLPPLCRLLPWPPSPPCRNPSSTVSPGLQSPSSRPSLFGLLYLKKQPCLPLLINCLFSFLRLSQIFPIPIRIFPCPVVLVSSSLKLVEAVSGIPEGSP